MTPHDAAHEPLITPAQFERVRAVKADRTTKKSTKHKRAFRGLLRCAGCGRTLTGERQKAHIYYRCHTTGCRDGAIREDRLEAQLLKALGDLQIPAGAKTELKARLHTWLTNNGSSDIDRSVRLRLADATTRQDRLTDLLVDGSIDKAA